MRRNDNRGLTLVEVVVVVSIIGILAVALGFTFQGWVGSYRIESQTKELYVDLMNARARAMQRNRAHFVVVNANNYQLFEDTNGNNIVDDAALPAWATPRAFLYAVASGTGTVTMSTRGLVNPNRTIRFDIGTNRPDYDCIVLFDTRINMGLWTGGTCVAK